MEIIKNKLSKALLCFFVGFSFINGCDPKKDKEAKVTTLTIKSLKVKDGILLKSAPNNVGQKLELAQKAKEFIDISDLVVIGKDNQFEAVLELELDKEIEDKEDDYEIDLSYKGVKKPSFRSKLQVDPKSKKGKIVKIFFALEGIGSVKDPSNSHKVSSNTVQKVELKFKVTYNPKNKSHSKITSSEFKKEVFVGELKN